MEKKDDKNKKIKTIKKKRRRNSNSNTPNDPCETFWLSYANYSPGVRGSIAKKKAPSTNNSFQPKLTGKE